MKPRLGRTVYTVYRDSITKSTVAYLGKGSFIIEHFHKGYSYGYEYFYDSYGLNWFTKLSDAKKAVFDDGYLDEAEKKQLKWRTWGGDYWELVYKE